MAEYIVEVVRELRMQGEMTVEASSQGEAEKLVLEMMSDSENPLQTIDPRITWDDPEDIDFSFDIV